MAYLLSSHDVELQKMKGAAMLLRVKRVVDHEVGSDCRFFLKAQRLTRKRLIRLRIETIELLGGEGSCLIHINSI